MLAPGAGVPDMTSAAILAARRPGDGAGQPPGSLTDRIDGVLGDFLDSRGEFLTTVGPELQTVAAAASRFVLNGGKRLRPRFAYWGWRTVKSADADDTGLLQAAASLELLQACALVHDDIMDGSAVRRGTCATHAEFAALHRDNRWPGDAHRFGTAAALLIGDLLLTWADTMFAAAPLPAAARPSARAVYDQMRQLVIAGQYLDVLVQNRGDFSVEDSLRVARFKTSIYTVDGPLYLGAAAAEAWPEVYAVLSDYGAAVGEAFQLRDDVLGVFGDPSRTGKPVGDDLREGKRTLLVALAIRAASPAQADLLRRKLGDRSLDDADVAALREVISASGALDQVEQRITERTAEARRALRTDAISDQARAALENLAVVSTERST